MGPSLGIIWTFVEISLQDTSLDNLGFLMCFMLSIFFFFQIHIQLHKVKAVVQKNTK
jgi:hypothetical protein